MNYQLESEINSKMWAAFKECLTYPDTEPGWEQKYNKLFGIACQYDIPFATDLATVYYHRLEDRKESVQC